LIESASVRKRFFHFLNLFMKAEVLEAIIRFTDHAHGEQMRKYTPERYIVHPVRVMQICQQYSHDPALLAAALLHDVLEDTPVTQDEIRTFLLTQLSHEDCDRAIRYVIDLTDVYIKTNYPGMNRNIRRKKEAERLAHVTPEAQTIKYADIMDNSVDILHHDRHFGYQYLKEAQVILSKMNDGHRILHERALHTVKECLDKVPKVSL
jgi:guanosine-3',5'-bis(diphosphate) 3'-pyrophosphohydrolase